MSRNAIKSIPLITRIIKLPMLGLLGRKYYKYYKDLVKSQYLSLDQLKKIQSDKLVSLLKIAYYNVPFYTDLFDRTNIDIETIHSVNDIIKLPVISKSDLKSNFPKKTINKSIIKSRILYNSTSGSTGKPFAFALNWDKKDRIEALKMRNFEYTNYAYGKKYFSLWGFNPNLSLKSKFFQRFITKRKLLSAINMTDEIKLKYANKLIKSKNLYLEGYTSALLLLSKYMVKNNLKAQLSGVSSSAETIIPEYRIMMEKAFGCNIFNRYGTREFGDIAIECKKHKGLHVNMESFIIEILDDNNKPCSVGEDGRIVVTDLDNKIMPFIRYDTEDSAVLLNETCNCGRNGLILENPSGRIVDSIQTKEGRNLSFGFFVLTFEDYPIIDQFQVVQTTIDDLNLFVVKSKNFDTDVFLQLMEKVRNYCYPMNIEIKFVDHIPLEPSGKLRIIKGMNEKI